MQVFIIPENRDKERNINRNKINTKERSPMTERNWTERKRNHEKRMKTLPLRARDTDIFYTMLMNVWSSKI